MFFFILEIYIKYLANISNENNDVFQSKGNGYEELEKSFVHRTAFYVTK